MPTPDRPKVSVDPLLPRARTTLASVFAAEAAATVAVALLRSPELGVLFLAAAISTALKWHLSRRARLEVEALEELRHARVLLERREYEDSCLVAERVVASDCSPETRNAALNVLAQAAAAAGRPKKATEALHAISSKSDVDLVTRAAVDHANGRPERALAALEKAKEVGLLDRAAARLLLDHYASLGDHERVAKAAIDLARLLGRDDLRLVARALQAAGEANRAAQVLSACDPPSTAGGC